MTSAKELEALLKGETRPERRILLFVGAFTKALGEDTVIVVGGSAIELFTRGGYVSGDIDLVVSSPEAGERVLARWGFQRGGRLWSRDDLGLWVDLVDRDYTGNLDLTRRLPSPMGQVRVAAIEDCLVKRLASAKHWKIPTDLDQAEMLLRAYGDALDWAYVHVQAKRHAVEDVLEELQRLVAADTGRRARGRRREQVPAVDRGRKLRHPERGEGARDRERPHGHGGAHGGGGARGRYLVRLGHFSR